MFFTGYVERTATAFFGGVLPILTRPCNVNGHSFGLREDWRCAAFDLDLALLIYTTSDFLKCQYTLIALTPKQRGHRAGQHLRKPRDNGFAMGRLSLLCGSSDSVGKQN